MGTQNRKDKLTNFMFRFLYVGVVNLYKTRGKYMYLPIPQDIRDASHWLYQWGSSQLIHTCKPQLSILVLYMKYM